MFKFIIDMKILKPLNYITHGCLVTYVCLKACSPAIKNAKEAIPVVDRIVARTEVADTFQRVRPKTVGVIDFFSNDHININLDFTPDVSHGFVTSRIIEEGLPEANVKKFDVLNGADEDDNDLLYHNMDSILKKIRQDIKNGTKYHAINISLGEEIKFSSLNKQLGTNFSKENIKDKAKELK